MSEEGKPPQSPHPPNETPHVDAPLTTESTMPPVLPVLEEASHHGEHTLGAGLNSPSADMHPNSDGPTTPGLNVPPLMAAQSTEPPAKPHWKDQLQSLGQKIGQAGWVRRLGERIQNFEPMQTAEWASRTFARHNASGASGYGKAATIGLCAFFLADLLALVIGKYIPEPPMARLNRPNGTFRRPKTIDDYNIVFTRNLFNSAGVIPGEEAGPQTTNPQDLGGAPTRTTLPFNLVGTLILQDELRSIATIEDKSASVVYPVRVTDEIPAKAKILKIEVRKVTFLNTSNGRREFVDLPDDGVPNLNPRVAVGARPTAGPGIEKISPNQFNVQRSEVDNALKDLNKVLTEARAVPNFENGVANGYKLFQIVPNSIYDKLGLQNGDVISGLNGAPINDPGKAFEMLSELKTSNHLELQVKKDGKVQNYVYDIR